MKKSFYIGEIEITVREILFSVIIFSFFIGFGVWLSNPILKQVNEDALEVVSCVKVSDPEKFGYIKRTNAGGFLAEGTFVSDPVSIPDLDGVYMAIKRDKERYTMHTQTYVVSDGKGHSHVKTRTYWSWDVVHTDKWVSDSITFLNQRFRLKDIKYHWITTYNKTIKESSHIRYVYYTHQVSVDGLMRGKADDKSYQNLSFQENATIDKIVKKSENRIKNSPTVFFVLWIIFTIFAIIGFYAIENRWLED